MRIINKFYALILISTTLLLYSCQPYKFLKPKYTKIDKINYGFQDFENYGIRIAPLTNREFILFLCWNLEVYGYDYPDRVKSLIPSNKPNFDIENLLNNPNEFPLNYILNPKYIDYPLLGVSKFQLNEFHRWLTDRYNEYAAIKTGFLEHNFVQVNEDCFTSEAYLTGQYYGAQRTPFFISWKDNIFKSCFRAPFQTETIFLNDKDDYLKKLRFSKNNFLWDWNKQFISSTNNSTRLHILSKTITLYESNFPSYKHNSISIYEERINHENMNKFHYLDKIKVADKDSLGRFNFVIAGQTSLNRPLVQFVKPIEDKSTIINKLFFIAYNNNIDFSYWPNSN